MAGRRTTIVAGGAWLMCCVGLAAAAPPSVEAEVLTNLRTLSIGDHTLDDFALPEPFLRRVSDRIIRETYRERYHRVYRDGPDLPAPAAPAGDPAALAQTRRVAAERDARRLAARQAEVETRPELRGFRAALFEQEPWPATPTPELRSAAHIVARRLACTGLVATTCHAVAALRGQGFTGDETLDPLLRGVGLPVDLLTYFAAPNGGDLIAAIAKEIDDGATARAAAQRFAGAPFRFRPTRPGFRVATESGESDIGTLRVQLTRGTYWKGPGAGGSLDIVRQLAEQLPEVALLLTIEAENLTAFTTSAASWRDVDWSRHTLIVEPLTVSQWAQDNGKAGTITDENEVRLATIIPRYASRREEGSVYVPGETYLVEGLAAAGHDIIASPLLFQGGNLLAVRHPGTGEETLLIGEAEVYRNTSLGLTEEQVLEAFRIEFGVDRCVALPAVSFHLDYDVSVRAHDGTLIAFVNDTGAAVRLVLEAVVDALVAGGRVPADYGAAARSELTAGNIESFLSMMSRPLGAVHDPGAGYPLSFANDFARGSSDSPVGNLNRMLAALDILVAQTVAPDATSSGDRHAAAYVRALQRLVADQAALARELGRLGFDVVPVPSLALGDRSLTSLNGIHERRRYLMPAYGGLFSAVDAAAEAAFRGRLGPGVEIVPILSGESQRRFGAVHCAVSAYPRLDGIVDANIR